LNRTILLVDDEAEVLVVPGRFFQRNGWHVQRAAEADGAMALYAQERADVVLLDIGLQGVNGRPATTSLPVCARVVSARTCSPARRVAAPHAAPAGTRARRHRLTRAAIAPGPRRFSASPATLNDKLARYGLDKVGRTPAAPRRR
jgi:DNA-binding NarL/FixJ family response regulator